VPRIEIKRIKQFKDRIRSYKVELDGETIGDLNAGETFHYNLPSGSSILRLKIDWASNNTINFEISDNQVLYFECGNNVPIFLELLYISVLRNKYLWLKQVG